MAQTKLGKDQLDNLAITNSDIAPGANIDLAKLVDGLKLLKQADAVADTTSLKAAASGTLKLLICQNDEEIGTATVSLWTGTKLITFATIDRTL